MLQVVEVVGELPRRAAHVCRVGVVHLRPACDTRLEQQPAVPKGNLALQIGEILRSFGAGAHDAHLAAKNVPELRYLVEAGLAQQAARSEEHTSELQSR